MSDLADFRIKRERIPDPIPEYDTKFVILSVTRGTRDENEGSSFIEVLEPIIDELNFQEGLTNGEK